MRRKCGLNKPHYRVLCCKNWRSGQNRFEYLYYYQTWFLLGKLYISNSEIAHRHDHEHGFCKLFDTRQGARAVYKNKKRTKKELIQFMRRVDAAVYYWTSYFADVWAYRLSTSGNNALCQHLVKSLPNFKVNKVKGMGMSVYRRAEFFSVKRSTTKIQIVIKC